MQLLSQKYRYLRLKTHQLQLIGDKVAHCWTNESAKTSDYDEYILAPDSNSIMIWNILVFIVL